MQFASLLFIAAMSSVVIALPRPQSAGVESIQVADLSNLGYNGEASSVDLPTVSESGLDDELNELASSS